MATRLVPNIIQDELHSIEDSLPSLKSRKFAEVSGDAGVFLKPSTISMKYISYLDW